MKSLQYIVWLNKCNLRGKNIVTSIQVEDSRNNPKRPAWPSPREGALTLHLLGGWGGPHPHPPTSSWGVAGVVQPVSQGMTELDSRGTSPLLCFPHPLPFPAFSKFCTPDLLGRLHRWGS